MAEATATEEKPSVLILGGTGFIGRHLVHFLVTNDLTSKIRVADRVPPALAWLNDEHKKAFEQVDFKHANLINPGAVEATFQDEQKYDFVVNLATETKYSQTDPVYEEGIVQLSLNCAKEACKNKVKKYVEISSGQIFSTDKSPITEDISPMKPWTQIAAFKLRVEEILKENPDLNWIILRPAIVYGTGDKQGLTPRLIIGAIYKYIREKMRLLWTKDLIMHTVHVHDVVKAIWHCFNMDVSAETYNLVDKSSSTQGTISELISDIFDINHDYAGSVISSMTKLSMSTAVAHINDKHLEPWSQMCNYAGISNTPLSPYLDQELLYNKHTNMDGTKIESTGFVYEHPVLTKDSLQEVLEDYLKMGIFPNVSSCRLPPVDQSDD